MFRVLHRWAGVIAATVLIVISLTGFILSVFPLLSTDRTADRLNAGALVAAVQQNVPGAQQITVDTNGVVTANAFGADGFQQLVIDPATGASRGPVQTGALELWFEHLHRDLFLSDTGQIVVLLMSAGMLVLSISGYQLAARRMGGWRKLFGRDRGEGAGGLHLKIARVAGIGLILSSFTGLWMGAATLGLIPDPSPVPPFVNDLSTQAAQPADTLAALTAIPGDSLRSVSLPAAAGQGYEVETDAGAGVVDPATGTMVAWVARSGWSRAMDVVHMLHTGQGASLLGLVLGLLSLSVPVLSGSGVLVWLKGRKHKPKLPKASPEAADVIVLVGSEGGTTWRFAHAFASRLHEAGRGAHVAPMNDFAPERYHNAASIVLFAATYGDGDAPASATEFLERLTDLDEAPRAPLSVLGFGDSTFPDFCAYAEEVTRTAKAMGWALLVDTQHVDRQSERDFTAWGRAFSEASGVALGDVAGALGARPTEALRLVSKTLYGEDAQAPTAVLRFAMPRVSLLDRLLGRGFASFEAGDLLNIVPEGDSSPRSYSLASSNHDGFLEICVRKVPGGRCSSQLCSLKEGETISAYVTPNAEFHPAKGHAPVVLIGAGAGVGALAGMVRANAHQRPMHLFFGIRSRHGGYPFEVDFSDWQTEGRLTDLTLALSRGDKPRYVQNALFDEAAKIRDLALAGAQFMICGGRDMGEGVRHALDEILAPIESGVEALIEEGRYAVDVF